MRLRANAVVGGAIVGVVVVAALVSAFWTPYDPLGVSIARRFQPPSARHWLGTDEFGRDALSRILAGATTSAAIAAITVLFAVVAGTTVGLLAGFLRGWVDRIAMAINDAMLAFPGILLALGIVVVTGASRYGIVVALGLAYAPTVVRIVRGTVLSVREREFVEASYAIGNGAAYTMLRHVLPNCVAPIVVLATSMIGWVFLSESALSFLGLGVPPPAPTWGNMLAAARPYMERAAWLSIAPGVCIAVVLLGVNLLGDALRDRFDPAHGAVLSATPDLLRVEDLHVEGHRVVAVDGASFSVARGEVLAIVGESGSGKTMAARSILGLLPPGFHQTGGRILFEGADLSQAGDEQWRRVRGRAIGMVFQEPMVSLNPAMSIGAQMAEGLELHTKLSNPEIRQACLAMLERVQIADPRHCLDAYPHEFSGGMRQRIMLASVMLLRPKLLIADEPTTALDTLTQREVLDLMLALTRDHGTAVLLITHNLGLVARYARRAAVMRAGRVIETGDAVALLTHPRQAYTRELVDALPRRGAKQAAGAAGEPILAAQGLSVEFRRRRMLRRGHVVRAVDAVDVEIRAGETVAVVGGSGSGKTTLGRALLRLVPASAGRIVFRGHPVAASDRAALRALRLACQIVFQDPYSSLDPRMRVAAIVDEPLRHVPGLDRTARDARVAQTLGEVGLADYGMRYPHELSGGQRQRVAIARAIVRRPSLIVADEPVSSLDMTIQKQVLELFARLQRNYNFACLFVSHDLAAVEQIADRVVVMENGRIVEQGTRDQIFDAPRHAYTRALLDAAPTFGPQAGAADAFRPGSSR